MDVADLEARALAVEAAGSQRAQAALVSQLGQRIGLIHDLAQLTATEEILDRRRDALRIDERSRGHVHLIADGHALLDGAAELEKAFAQLVGSQLVDGAQP